MRAHSRRVYQREERNKHIPAMGAENYGDELGKSLIGVKLKTIETDSLVAGRTAVSEQEFARGRARRASVDIGGRSTDIVIVP